MFRHEEMTQKLNKKLMQHLPGQSRFLLGALPDNLVQSGLNTWLNRIFKPSLRAGELCFLHDRSVCIEVSDIELRFAVTLRKNGLQAFMKPSHADVTFKATSIDLLLLITGKLDPDTLFFRRRLMITGDTELGLALKNFLDTLDAKMLIPTQLYPFLNQLAQGFADQNTRAKSAPTRAC